MIESTITNAAHGRIRALLLGALATLLGGCVIGPDAKPGDPAYAPVSAPAMLPPPPNQGGIYQTNGGLSLFEDKRARRVGDVITIVLSESTTSSKKADTAIAKKDAINLDAGVVLGSQPRAGGVNMTTTVNPSRAFDGASSADQSNRLVGTITVMVSDVLPDNTISSTKIADVRIAYSGSGELAASNQQGWASQFFGSKWWPF